MHKRSYTRPVILLLLILANILVVRARAADQKAAAAQIDQLLTAYHKTGQFNGSAMVARDGEVVLAKGYGLANAEWNIPNAPNVKFRIASITKQFTAMLVMQQVAEGKIKLDGTVCDYLPWYRKDTGSKVTIHHLLTHTSGIPSYTDRDDFDQFTKLPMGPLQPFIEKEVSGDLQWEPGTKWKYNNSGFLLLTEILERVTSKPYEQLLRDRILLPLGMNNTGYDHNQDILPRRAAGYHGSITGLHNAEFTDMSWPQGAGAMYSTVEDMLKWDQALYTNKLLPTEYKEKMFTPFLNDYAYGWMVKAIPDGQPGAGGRRISHLGGIQGFQTIIARYPKDKLLVVLLANVNGPPLVEIDAQIARVLYGEKPQPVKETISHAIGPVVVKDGVAAAVARYRELKAKSADAYRFDEPQLNALGYELMGMGRVKDAIEIFKLNVEMFPQAFNTYDSLGEAYMNDGQKERAIANYRKSLELNPESESGKTALKKLTEAPASGE